MTLKKTILFVYIALIPIDGTRYFSIFVGPFEVNLLDILLMLAFFTLVSEYALKEPEFKTFSKTIGLLLFAAGVLSIISLLYVPLNTGYDIKISLKLFEHTLLIIIMSFLITDMATMRQALKVFCFTVAIYSFLTILKSIGLPVPGSERMTSYRILIFQIGVIGLSENAMFLTLLVVSAFPLIFSKHLFKSNMIRGSIGILYVMAAIVSYTRSAWIGISVEIFLFFFFWSVKRGTILSRCAIIAITPGLIALLFLYVQGISEFLLNTRISTVTQRVDGYLAAIHMVMSNPVTLLFGFGKGAFYSSNMSGHGVPHNIIIDLWVSKGLVTLTIICLIYFMVIWRLIKIFLFSRHGNDPVMIDYAGMILITMVGLFASSLLIPSTNSIVLWSVFSLACAFISINEKLFLLRSGSAITSHA